MATILEYKCPCCAGVINFDSTRQKMRCQYCDTEFDIETLEQFNSEMPDGQADADPDWESLGEGERWQDGEDSGVGVYTCSSCGGEIVGDETTAATSCPFCGSSVILTGNLSGTYKPDYVIPFKIDKDAAKAAMKKFLEKKPLLPDSFKTDSRIDSIQGMYVPFWLFDCDVDAAIKYRATRVTHWSDSNYNYRKTDHFLLVRAGDIAFERVPVDGSSKMDDAYMESIEPYDYGGLESFSMPYLSGFLADKYDVDEKDSIPRANDRIRNSTYNAFSSTTLGYTTCRPVNTSIKLNGGATKYALLPVWVLNTKYEGKIYPFCMNGQTGKFVGQLPVDKAKWWKWFLGISGACMAVAGAIASLVMFL